MCLSHGKKGEGGGMGGIFYVGTLRCVDTLTYTYTRTTYFKKFEDVFDSDFE